MSQEFFKTKTHTLADLSRLAEILLGPQSPACSGRVPVTSRRNLTRKNQGTRNNSSQNELHPELGVPLSQTKEQICPEETLYMVAIVQKEILFSSYTATGV